MRAGTFGIIVALLVILAGAVSYAYLGLIGDGEPMPADGVVALTVGIIFSLAIGCGLMALLFYSSRNGYDEAPRLRDE